MAGQLARENVARADKQQGDLPVTGRHERAIDDAAGAMITTKRVDCDPHESQNLCLFDLADLASFVVATVRADLVRRLGLVALRTDSDGNRIERVVRHAR